MERRASHLDLTEVFYDIESVNDQLKNLCQIEHTRHRSVANFMVNLVAGMIAYTYRPEKPSLFYRELECNSRIRDCQPKSPLFRGDRAPSNSR